MKLRIEQDQDAMSPAEWEDEAVFLVANHRDFFVPPNKHERNFDVAAIIEENKKGHHVFLLEAYIHSGVRLALAGEGNFPDRRWDVSTLGAVFVAKSGCRTRKAAYKVAQSKVEEWNMYLSGDVWGFIIEDDDGNHLDSCWGFYGREYCEREGAQALKYAKEHSLSEANAI